MKNQIFFHAFLITVLFLLNIESVQAQEGARSFANGITIATKTEIIPKDSPNALPNIKSYETSSAKENIIYRVLTNEKTKAYFGYDLEVEAASGKDKYKVIIKPLSSEEAKKSAEKDGFRSQPLPKYPDAVEVSEGDTIALDVMENPQTKEKVTDYIKILYKPAPFTDYFAERTPVRDFTMDDVSLSIINFEVFAGKQSILKVGGGASAAYVFLYLEGKGRFIFSLFPRAGYDFQKIGEIENNRISFKQNGINYTIVSSKPIVGNGGHWNLWVLYDANYVSPFYKEYAVGAFDKINLTKY